MFVNSAYVKYNRYVVKKKHRNQSKTISNRRARHDYELGDSLVAGLELNGREVKALRMGHGQLRGAYVTVKDSAKGGELWLINASISGTNGIPLDEEEQTRSRKLLAKRSEIDKLIASKKQGNTIIPLEILTGGRYIKIRIASGRGKKLYDKRQTQKAKDEKRQIQSALR